MTRGPRGTRMGRSLGVLLGLAMLAVFSRGNAVEANHAYLHSQGIGFTQVNDGFWVDVYVHDTTKTAESIAAIDLWRHWKVDPNRWWLRHTGNPAEAEVEIMDRGATSIFGAAHGAAHTTGCNLIPSTSYARTFASDDTNTSLTTRAWVGSWATNPGHPFLQVTVCINPDHANNQGTIAHEMGHALGLNHVNIDFQTCSDTGRNSVMAYNYTNANWANIWSYAVPTSSDVFGRWVCGNNNSAGLARVYQLAPDNGFPSATADTDTDGCVNVEETGADPNLGGERNPLNRFDFPDLDGDKAITILDLSINAGYFGLIAVPPALDLDGDYIITIVDLSMMGSQFGHSCAAAPN